MEIHRDPAKEVERAEPEATVGAWKERAWRLAVGLAIPILFVVYLTGIGDNPPGYYVDESGLSYNAYLVSQTGAGEFGDRFPIYFQLYTGGFTQYSNPTQIYILAAVYKLFGPGILISRVTAATCVFLACVLLGLLASRMTGNRIIGVLVGSSALALPWLFEVGRLVLETFFYPLAVVLFLLACHRVYRKTNWHWTDIFAIAACLALLTYSYTIGRLFGPLMALGLVLLINNRKGLISVAATWALYGVSLVPLAVYMIRNLDLTARFRLLSYIKPESSFGEILVTFIGRYLEDINPKTMLFVGDVNPRHHIQDALGSIFICTFVLALIGLIIVAAKRRHDRWWRFLAYGLAASVVPGALTVDAFHTLRMIPFPIFLLLFTIPPVDWLICGSASRLGQTSGLVDETNKHATDGSPAPIFNNWRLILAGFAALLFFVEAGYFHLQYYEHGPGRGYVFDAAYRAVYDQAVAQPDRPIYLEDGYWGPMYIHSLWYATLEGRATSEFVHLGYGERPPSGSVVISSEKDCGLCQVVSQEEIFMLYLAY